MCRRHVPHPSGFKAVRCGSERLAPPGETPAPGHVVVAQFERTRVWDEAKSGRREPQISGTRCCHRWCWYPPCVALESRPGPCGPRSPLAFKSEPPQAHMHFRRRVCAFTACVERTASPPLQLATEATTAPQSNRRPTATHSLTACLVCRADSRGKELNTPLYGSANMEFPASRLTLVARMPRRKTGASSSREATFGPPPNPRNRVVLPSEQKYARPRRVPVQSAKPGIPGSLGSSARFLTGA